MQRFPMKHKKNFLVKILFQKAERSLVQVGRSLFLIEVTLVIQQILIAAPAENCYRGNTSRSILLGFLVIKSLSNGAVNP